MIWYSGGLFTIFYVWDCSHPRMHRQILENFCLDRASRYLVEHIGVNLLVEFLEVFMALGHKMVHFCFVSFV